MPYIKQDDRKLFDEHIDKIAEHLLTLGELNYCITRICHKWIENRGLRYNSINDVMGALECAKMEAYAKIARPYEEDKIVENGDVKPNVIK